MSKVSKVKQFIEDLKKSPRLGSSVTHHQHLNKKKGNCSKLELELPEKINRLLQFQNINRLYSHQVQSILNVQQGYHTVISTPTSSGKSVVYTLPVLETYLNDHSSSSLFLFPLKALAQDQLKKIKELLQAWPETDHPKIAVYDGDTPTDLRTKIRRNPPNILITNPDMLHVSILPNHHLWTSFLKRLKTVVVDEVHTYRGVMGSNMSWVFRRLLRLTEYYNSRPTFIFCSATIGNPDELASKLTGLSVQKVDSNGAPQGEKHFIFLNPLEGAAQTAVMLLQSALSRGLRTIVYSQSRKMTELIALWAGQRCHQYKHKISAYRSGFLPSERREIEAKLSQGQLLGVISTSALELGIDIGSLDLCLLVGYPGSVMSTWQRGGRVGRQQQDSGIILIGQEDNLDQYFLHNPNKFFELSPEKAVINPYNPVILKNHLQCASADLPLDQDEKFLQIKPIKEEIESLKKSSILISNSNGKKLFPANQAIHQQVNLRGTGQSFLILNQSTQAQIGNIDYYRAFQEAHPGAVYLHKGQSFVIDELLVEQKRVLASPKQVNYFTRVRKDKQTKILEKYEYKSLGQAKIALGKLKITEIITGYEKRLVKGQKLVKVIPLQLDPLEFETEGIWLEIPISLQKSAEKKLMHFMGGIHALEHVLIGIMPLLILTDRNDLGGIAQPAHPQLDCPAVFIYDGIPGGMGLTRQAFSQPMELLKRAQELLQSCPCEQGCPGCVHSPKCGSGNKPLDKNCALFILQEVLSAKTSEPKTQKYTEINSNLRSFTITASQPKETEKNYQSMEKKQPPKRYGVLDLETQRSAQEVGGWHQAQEMGISCAVLYDSYLEEYFIYLEENISGLIDHLQNLDLIVGFNIQRFDYKVLQGYSPFPFDSLPTFDILKEIKNSLGYRLSLANLTTSTLGSNKSADGSQALRWWKQGKIKNIISYCRQDVALTKDLYVFGCQNNYLLFKNKAGKIVRLEVDW